MSGWVCAKRPVAQSKSQSGISRKRLRRVIASLLGGREVDVEGFAKLKKISGGRIVNLQPNVACRSELGEAFILWRGGIANRLKLDFPRGGRPVNSGHGADCEFCSYSFHCFLLYIC